jgi:hypothetical protein
MDDIGAIVGVITGLISIFTFLTGVSSLQVLRSESRSVQGEKLNPSPRPRVFVRSRVLVWLTFAVFVASLAVTLAMGLSGGDVEGAIFVLLLMGGIGVTVYVLRFRHMISPLSFGAVSTLVLGGAGFAFGSISRGEEAVDAVAGLVIGMCITVIAWLFRTDDTSVGEVASAAADTARDSAAPRAPAADNDHERALLRNAAEKAGEVTTASVALETELSLEEARTLLESLHERGFCERTRTEQGATVYRFPDLV